MHAQRNKNKPTHLFLYKYFRKHTYTSIKLYTNCNANHALWQVSRVYTLETHQWIFVGCNQTFVSLSSFAATATTGSHLSIFYSMFNIPYTCHLLELLCINSLYQLVATPTPYSVI